MPHPRPSLHTPHTAPTLSGDHTRNTQQNILLKRLNKPSVERQGWPQKGKQGLREREKETRGREVALPAVKEIRAETNARAPQQQQKAIEDTPNRTLAPVRERKKGEREGTPPALGYM